MYVYIATNASRTLYIGVTNDLRRRIYEHKHKLIPGFTSRYNIGKLAYFEAANSPNDAIQRERELKGWLRQRKVKLIESVNPDWNDLASGWE